MNITEVVREQKKYPWKIYRNQSDTLEIKNGHIRHINDSEFNLTSYDVWHEVSTKAPSLSERIKELFRNAIT